MNINDILKLLSGNQRPEEAVINILKQNSGNPMAAQLLSYVQSGNTQAIENIARNVAKEKGVDFDQEFNNFRRILGR